MGSITLWRVICSILKVPPVPASRPHYPTMMRNGAYLLGQRVFSKLNRSHDNHVMRIATLSTE